MANFTPICKKILRFFTNTFHAEALLTAFEGNSGPQSSLKTAFFEHFVLCLQKKSLSSQRNLTNTIP